MSSIPKLDYPTYNVQVPSTSELIKVTPMRVKDEKILLMAKEGKNPSEVFNSILQVVKNCATLTGDPANLTIFDIEYLFLKIRSYSVGNKVKVSYSDAEDEKVYDFEIDLDTVTVKPGNSSSLNIKLTDRISLALQYPKASIYFSDEFKNEETKSDDLTFALIRSCLKSYHTENTTVPLNDRPKEEIDEFINNLDIKTYNQLREFISQLPTLYHKIEYKNSKGTARQIELTSLTDFFMF